MEWQLIKLPNGELELYHEDVIHGNDIVIILTEDGDVEQREWVDDGRGDLKEQRTRLDSLREVFWEAAKRL